MERGILAAFYPTTLPDQKKKGWGNYSGFFNEEGLVRRYLCCYTLHRFRSFSALQDAFAEPLKAVIKQEGWSVYDTSQLLLKNIHGEN